MTNYLIEQLGVLLLTISIFLALPITMTYLIIFIEKKIKAHSTRH